MCGEQVGKISRKIFSEKFAYADLFRISFPKTLDVRMKAILLGASFLIVSLNC